MRALRGPLYFSLAQDCGLRLAAQHAFYLGKGGPFRAACVYLYPNAQVGDLAQKQIDVVDDPTTEIAAITQETPGALPARWPASAQLVVTAGMIVVDR